MPKSKTASHTSTKVPSKSKTASHTSTKGLNDRDAQAETISLPNNKEIIDDYELYFTKHPVNAIANFYLKPCTANDRYFRHICETTDITIGDRIISNHSGRKTTVQVLKGLGYSDSVVMSITRHRTQQGLASYECHKSVMQQQGLNRFFNALTFVANSLPSELQGQDSEIPDQAEKTIEAFGD
ncbi:336_t:CDS:2 [Gigaspora rosea]|nr:336_t:CDS:2 [Gigaspora rosea]